MIPEQIQENLFNIFWVIKGVPGWLAHCKEAQYSDEEMEYLEKLADEMSPLDKGPEIEKFEAEVRKGGGYDLWSLENDEEKIVLLTRKIFDLYKRIDTLFKKDAPFIEIKMLAPVVGNMEKLRYKIRARQIHKDIPGSLDSISESMIVRARQYPMEKLVDDMTKHGYTVCPFHDDSRPSMLIKNGFGWCFSCQTWTDPIKWVMTTRGYDFKTTVKYLSGMP